MTRTGPQAALGLTLMAGLWLSGCGGGLSSTPPPQKSTPAVTVTPSVKSMTANQALTVTVSVSGSNGTPTGSVILSAGAYSSPATTLSSGSAAITIPANTLATGAVTLSAGYTPDASSASIYNSTSGTVTVTVLTMPSITVAPSSGSITTTQALTVTISVSGAGNTPTGSVTLSSGSYASMPSTLSNGSVQITIPAGSLSVGTDSLTAQYTPDTTSASIYANSIGSNSVKVSLDVPVVAVTPGSNSIPTTQALTVTVTVSGGGTSPAPTGSVTLSSGTYTSGAATLSSGSASINIPAGSLAAGSDTLTAKYTPDMAGSAIYASASGTNSVTVTSATTYVLTVDSTAPASGITIGASPEDVNSKSSGVTPFTLTYSTGTQVTLSAGQLDDGYSFVSWTGCTSTPSTGVCDVTVNANTTVTVNYNQTGITSITITPNTATIGTQQQFTATVNGAGSFSKSVSWSLSCPACGSLSEGDFASTTTTTALYNTPYPAPASVTITATSTQDTSVSGSVTVALNPPAASTGPSLLVDINTPNTPAENPHTISPYVYGMNAYALDSASEKIADPAILRWGGDDTSRYNYQNDMTNSASDYYFESFQGAAAMFPNSTSSNSFTSFVESTDAAGSAALGTVPVLGWVTNNQQYACSFPESQFPGQEEYNGNNCGNGVEADGTDLYGSNAIAATTSISEPPPDIMSSSTPGPGSANLPSWAAGTWAGEWVNSVVSNASLGNGASGKGVAVWDLDNEPTWWDAVHRDVHPDPFTYDEVTNGDIGTALAIKTADPTALVSGPVIDWWWAYFYSKEDIENGWSSGPCYQPWSNPTDRAAHGGTALMDYYLQQFQQYSQEYGIRLLDYVDIHGYFAPDYPVGSGNSVGLTTAGDTQEQQTRMNGTRVYWDPTYTDPNYPQPNYSGAPAASTNCSPPLQAPELVRLLKSWVSNDYPGTPTDPTRTAIDEYNFGGLESINGAVTQADILGIFGREGLDMGAFWPSQAYDTQGPGNFAFAMYRNYDGNDSTFGDTYLYATSTASGGGDGEGQLAVYGGLRSTDNSITVMVINKTYGSLTSTISLENFVGGSGLTAQVYQYSNASLTAIATPGTTPVTPPSGGGNTSTISYTFPGQSITLLVVPN